MNEQRAKGIIISTCGAALVVACAIALFRDNMIATRPPSTATTANSASLAAPTPAGSQRFQSDGSHVADPLGMNSTVQPLGIIARNPSAAAIPDSAMERSISKSVHVALAGDLLTIRSVDAPFEDVLDAVHRATGASVEIERYAGERVTVDVRSMPIREALRALLDGSRYDYMLVSSTEEPKSVERIVLSARKSDANRAASVPAPRRVDERITVTAPVLDPQQDYEHQQRQFDQAFGACIAQGCDAS